MDREKGVVDPQWTENTASRQGLEDRAMQAVMEKEQRLGFEPRDVSGKNGAGISNLAIRTAISASSKSKERARGTTMVTVTKNEILASFNQPDRYILAIALVDGEQVDGPLLPSCALRSGARVWRHEPQFRYWGAYVLDSGIMAVTLTEAEIEALMNEEKQLPANFENRLQARDKGAHREKEISVRGSEGNEFRVVLRQSRLNPLDFSVILVCVLPNSKTRFRLRRYNGRSHEHTNKLERDRFYDFHIHYATERYQEAGWKEDAYAQPTDRYHDFRGALNCLLADAGFNMPAGPQIEFL